MNVVQALGNVNVYADRVLLCEFCSSEQSFVATCKRGVHADQHLLRFDPRYNRAGEGVGGGSDAMMFRTLLARGARIRYRPDMVILHSVDPWKLRRSYFLKLHYRAGVREGQFRLPTYPRTVLGIPPFLASQFLSQSWRALRMQLHGGGAALRQGMNAAHTLGNIVGYRRRRSAPVG